MVRKNSQVLFSFKLDLDSENLTMFYPNAENQGKILSLGVKPGMHWSNYTSKVGPEDILHYGHFASIVVFIQTFVIHLWLSHCLHMYLYQNIVMVINVECR